MKFPCDVDEVSCVGEIGVICPISFYDVIRLVFGQECCQDIFLRLLRETFGNSELPVFFSMCGDVITLPQKQGNYMIVQ